MKNFNKNIILFSAFILAVIIGFWGGGIQSLLANLGDSFNELESGNKKNAISVLKNTDTISSEDLLYHDALVDINSAKENITNAAIVSKESKKIIKCKSDMLAFANKERFDRDYLDSVAETVSDLKRKSESAGAKFLYLAVPEKAYYQTFPSNVIDYSRVNFDDYLNCLEDHNIPTLSFVDEFKKLGLQNEEIYYYTDTHWITNIGLLAAKLICGELNKRYDIPCDSYKLDLNNYTQKQYSNWFLGALGKNAGTYFTWRGADDFNLITPKFNTLLTEERPFENAAREGSFVDTVLFMDQIETKNYYHHDPYSGYCGGNHRLQIFKNRLENNGQRGLFIRDSFSHVVTPFLALQFDELRLGDTRGSDIELYDEPVNWYEYIDSYKPDVVLVLYKGVPNKTMLDFEGKL